MTDILNNDSLYLSKQWKQLGRLATFVAVLTSPAAFFAFHRSISLGWSLVFTILSIGAFRGLVDLILKALVPRPSLFGLDDKRLAESDVLFRRRTWFWRQKYKWATILIGLVVSIAFLQILLIQWPHLGHGITPWGTAGVILHAVKALIKNKSVLIQLAIMPMFFFVNFGILMGPMMLMGIMQIRGFEPGDADWGVKLDDVRGQKEAKEDVRKIVTLWQSGELFAKAGGKRERGILFIGSPGTGKTMLAKAIATGFNCPIVTIPGSGFAQTFIGMDAIIVRFLARKARKLAKKWGGQCIVFIDEIDAVGMRRSSLQGGGGMMGGMMMGGGQLALNQLLVVMDGIDSPPLLRRIASSKINSLLDALYVFPRRIKNIPLRVPRAKPSTDQIYFIGATNVSLEVLDPALVRPGRLGRHIFFRDPTVNDRKDVFDLYLSRVTHDETVNIEELARISDGYSPAQIEQACSLALTRAIHDGRPAFTRDDILEAMTTVDMGTSLGWDYTPEEKKAIAVHEAGHAIAAHMYMKDKQHNRLSVRRRGDSGGHHSATDKEDRFVKWRDEVFGELIWSLGSLAAEYVLYGQNSQGVGGDLGSVTSTACSMVGGWGMGPDTASEEDTEAYIEIGKRLIQLSGVSEASPSYYVLDDSAKFDLVAQLIGQAYYLTYNLMLTNKKGIETLSDALVEQEEIYGDDLTDLLEHLELRLPTEDEEEWPQMR